MNSLEFLFILGGFWLVHLLAVISLGPSLVVITKTSMSVSRQAGIANALCFGVGSVIWALAGIFGLGILFATVPWIYLVVKTADAFYLIFLGYRLLRSNGILDQTAARLLCRRLQDRRPGGGSVPWCTGRSHPGSVATECQFGVQCRCEGTGVPGSR